MEDEIDLKQYLQILLKHWKIIAGITLAAVVISAGVTLLTPPVYEARATVLCMGDAKTLVGLAKSPAVGAVAAEKLAGKLDANERSAGVLLNAVGATVRDNLIDITATSASQQKAADIANAWTEAYISYATDYYNKLQPTSEELKTEAAAALAIYNAKNEELIEFQEQVKRNDTSNCLACTELLYDVQMLRQKMSVASGQTRGNMLNQAFYQYQARAYSMMFPGTQISPDKGQVALADESTVTLADIDQLINMLEKGAGISSQSPEILLNIISEMKLKKAAENMKLDELTYARDTTRGSYLELVKQAMNADLARQAPRPQLRLIEIAVPVDTPVTGIKWVNICIAFVLGLIAGVFSAFVAEYFEKKRPAKGETA